MQQNSDSTIGYKIIRDYDFINGHRVKFYHIIMSDLSLWIDLFETIILGTKTSSTKSVFEVLFVIAS